MRSRLLLKRGAIVPAIVVVIFIFFWMVIAYTPLSHLYRPDLYTLVLFIVFGTSILIGGFFASLSNVNRELNLDKKKYIRDKKRVTVYFWVILSLTLPAALFIGLRAYDFVQTHSFAMLRSVAWGSDSLDYHLFVSGGIRRIYQYTIIPSASILSLIGFFLFVVDKKLRYLILGFLPAGILTVSQGGRFFFLFAIFALFITVYMAKFLKIQEYYLLSPDRKIFVKPVSKRKGVILLGFSIFAIPIAYVSIERGAGLPLTELLRHYVIHYNVVGFSLFSDALYSANSPLQKEMTLGLASLRAPIFAGYDILRQLGFDTWYPVADYFYYTSDRVLVGHDSYSNAFYTALYPLYLDGRFIGVVVGGIVYGYALTLAAQFWIVRNHIYWLLFMVLLFQHLMASLYNFPLTSNTFFFGSLLLVGLQLVSRVRFRVTNI